ncbi:MAG: DUF192 domain-containing protein [candidate division Zixibacteria bacterium]|nr:DUF192 domain-containing protein [candidate division Zixibacteria bacterium]
MSKKKKRNKGQSKKQIKTQPRINQRLIWLIFGIVVVTAVLISRLFSGSEQESQSNNIGSSESSVYDFKKEGEVVFFGEDGAQKIEIDVEIADDPGEITLGLMYREKLNPLQGMLFIFPEEAPRSFWMRNTILPLDMIFADNEGKIVTIHEHTVPFSQESYVSTIPARYVVEVNAGFCNSHDIKTGDKIEWKRVP